MIPRRLTRRQSGVLQNFANQVAQMAVGWELLINQGSKFVAAPSSGSIQIDVLPSAASLNGEQIDLGMANYLRKWIIDEIRRHHLPDGWLNSATVDIRYTFDAEHWRKKQWADVDLVGSAEVNTIWGRATALHRNSQYLSLT